MSETTFSMFTPAAQRVLQAGLNLTAPPKPAQTLTEKHRPRTLADMVGQGLAVFRLQAFLEAPYSCAFLFEGPTGVGKTTAALALAAELGAVEFGGLDTIKSGMQDAEAVEGVLRGLHYTPMCGSGWKVVIVDEADYMSPKAAQLWLSALEDLPSRSVIVFTTNHVAKFPDRFLDRCERLQFESDATIHQQDAETLIATVWLRETGRAGAPRLAQLPSVIDADGQLSYRRVIRALEPLLASAKRGVPAPAPAPKSKPARAARPPGAGRTRRFDAAEHVDWTAEGERFKAGETCVQIGQRLGLSWNKVYSMLEKAGVDVKRR